MELLERSTVIIVVPLLSVMTDQVDGYRTYSLSIHTVLFPEPKVMQRKLKSAKRLSKVPGETSP